MLLPRACHSSIEALFDFLYGADVSFTVASALELMQIGHVLQNDALTGCCLAYLLDKKQAELDRYTEVILACELPPRMVEPVLMHLEPTTILSCLAQKPHMPSLQVALQVCSAKIQKSAPVARATWRPDAAAANAIVQVTQREVHFRFSDKGSLPLDTAALQGTRALCRLRIVALSGSGPTIGLAKLSANSEVCRCEGGGFALNQNCWGLCLIDCRLYSEGSVVGSSGHSRDAFLNQVVIMEVSRSSSATNELRFALECMDGSVKHVGSIVQQFSEHSDLVFMASACCSNTAYAMLELQDNL